MKKRLGKLTASLALAGAGLFIGAGTASAQIDPENGVVYIVTADCDALASLDPFVFPQCNTPTKVIGAVCWTEDAVLAMQARSFMSDFGFSAIIAGVVEGDEAFPLSLKGTIESNGKMPILEYAQLLSFTECESLI